MLVVRRKLNSPRDCGDIKAGQYWETVQSRGESANECWWCEGNRVHYGDEGDIKDGQSPGTMQSKGHSPLEEKV